jgi:hypothetical protein
VVPRQFLWLVEAIGFKADRDLALKELQLASESEGYQSKRPAAPRCLSGVSSHDRASR